MDNKTEFKFSWTRKMSDGSYHKASGDTVDEVMDGMDELESRIGGTIFHEEKIQILHPERAEDASDKQEWLDLEEKYKGKTLDEIPEVDESFCQVHQTKMKERIGKNGVFYSHSKGVYPDLTWCSGKGWAEK